MNVNGTASDSAINLNMTSTSNSAQLEMLRSTRIKCFRKFAFGPVNRALRKLYHYENTLSNAILDIEDQPDNIETLEIAKNLIQMNLAKANSMQSCAL